MIVPKRERELIARELWQLAGAYEKAATAEEQIDCRIQLEALTAKVRADTDFAYRKELEDARRQHEAEIEAEKAMFLEGLEAGQRLLPQGIVIPLRKP